ncbi:MAG TPA: pilin [Bacillota bacterium]|nr:pilin [Bacillota bacterium]
MLQTLRTKMATIGTALMLLLVPMAVPAVAHAQGAGGNGGTDAPAAGAVDIGNCLSQGSDLTTGTGTGCTASQSGAGTAKIQTIVTTIVNIFSIVVGIIAVIMIVVGGFKYITSGGDSGNITSAKNTIVYAVIGLVIVALAQFIVKFVLDKVNNTGAAA